MSSHRTSKPWTLGTSILVGLALQSRAAVGEAGDNHVEVAVDPVVDGAQSTESASEPADEWPLPGPAEAEDTLLRELSLRHYAFCSDPDYVLFKGERRLCRFAKSASARCPAFTVVCAKPASLDREGSLFGEVWAGRSDDESPLSPDPPTWELKVPESLVAVFRIVFFLAVGLSALWLAVYLIRNLRRFDTEKPGKAKPSVPMTLEQAHDPRQTRGVESDVSKLLARAKALAARGDYPAATHDVYAALLRYLDHSELLKLHPSKTNGDYQRALTQHPALRDALRDSVKTVEKSQFGGAPPDEAAFRRSLSLVEPLVTRVLVMLLYLCFGSLVALPLVGCDTSGPSGRTGTADWGALADGSGAGFRVLKTLLEQRGVRVDNHRGRISAMAPDVDAMVIYDRTQLVPSDWENMNRWVTAGHHLVIAGDPRGAAHFGVETGPETCAAPLSPGRAYSGIRRTDAEPYADPATVSGEASSFLLISDEGSDFVPLINCGEQPIALWRPIGLGTLTILADADLLSNASLAAGDNALLFTGALPSPPARMVFAGGLVGAGAGSPLQSLANARLNLVLVQIALLLAALYWAKGAAFAKRRDPETGERREFLEHIEAIGRVFARGRAASHALNLYASWALERLHARIRPGSRLSVIELGAAIAERTGRKQGDVVRVLAEAASSRDRRGQVSDPAEDLRTLKELEQLVIETGGTR